MSANSVDLRSATPPENPTELDFSRRALLREWMDEPCSYEEFRDCLKDLEQVNRLTFAHPPTLRWLQPFVQSHAGSAPLHIVDVGCGGGDMLRHIERWATKQRLSVRLTGIDLNPHAVRAAQEFTKRGSSITWVNGDAFSYAPPEGIDVVISSLFTHHLPEEEIPQFMAWMERVTRRGWFINDLSRASTPYWLFRPLAAVMRWHRFVRHDGPISIRRAFSPQDWRRYAEQARLDPTALQIQGHMPARLCVSRVKG